MASPSADLGDRERPFPSCSLAFPRLYLARGLPRSSPNQEPLQRLSQADLAPEQRFSVLPLTRVVAFGLPTWPGLPPALALGSCPVAPEIKSGPWGISLPAAESSRLPFLPQVGA